MALLSPCGVLLGPLLTNTKACERLRLAWVGIFLDEDKALVPREKVIIMRHSTDMPAVRLSHRLPICPVHV
jgi:hypothetical protein